MERIGRRPYQKESVENSFKNAVLTYMETLLPDAPGISVLKTIQFIADCLEYNLFVRTSICVVERKKPRDCKSSRS